MGKKATRVECDAAAATWDQAMEMVYQGCCNLQVDWLPNANIILTLLSFRCSKLRSFICLTNSDEPLYL